MILFAFFFSFLFLEGNDDIIKTDAFYDDE